MAASTNVVQITGEANGSVHPAIKVRKAAGADSVRRRLSSIFQRPIRGIGARIRSPLASRRVPDDPRQQLPVTASPAVLASRGDLIVRAETHRRTRYR